MHGLIKASHHITHSHTHTHSKLQTHAHNQRGTHTCRCVCMCTQSMIYHLDVKQQFSSAGDLNPSFQEDVPYSKKNYNCETFGGLQRGNPDTRLQHIMIEGFFYISFFFLLQLLFKDTAAPRARNSHFE